ncbi:RNA-binding protein [Methanohalophilus levihalophilus]|uniref:YhbY family RNA-binding protein n=1 Tax=Methanohalophilus levihalophilus TaxID=1431282 RepID=UPI001AE1637D|nr:YhbY family RNA-binding protein [Methanohalophilus levihalophilus]MBP2030844.1 RNA-binding protein [Methanohalophilus levihalophilus]
MDKAKQLQLRSEASQLKPLLNVGKKGLDDSVIDEIKKQLKARRLIKIKVLRSAEEEMDVKAIGEELSRLTSSELIDVRGRAVVLYR